MGCSFIYILGFSEILMSSLENDDSDENFSYAEIINKSAVSTYELLENLLAWSKIQSNNMKYKPEKLFISEVIDDCILKLKQIGGRYERSSKTKYTRGRKAFRRQRPNTAAGQ